MKQETKGSIASELIEAAWKKAILRDCLWFYFTSINKIMKGKANLASAISFERINKAQTNRSTTKQAFSFSKGQRFLEVRPQCPEHAYNGDFKQKQFSGTAIGFGTRSDFTKAKDSSPPANKYRLRTFWQQNAQKNKGSKFALGRQKVSFSNYIPNDPLAFPAPNNYQVNGNLTRRSAPKYSVRQKTNLLDKKLTLQPQNCNPGPGTYENPQLSRNHSMNSIAKYQNVVYSQPKSKRFFTSQTVTPGPGKYDDIVMLAQTGNYVLSQHKGGTKGKFDNEKRETVFEKTHSKDFQVPGPGSYISPSQFGQYDSEYLENLLTLRKNNSKLSKIKTQR